MEFSHELIVPNEDLPFKLFLFEGSPGRYRRDKHWHRSVEIFAVFDGRLDFYLNEDLYPLDSGDFMLVNSNEIHSIYADQPNKTVVLQMPLNTFEAYFTGEQFIHFDHCERPQDRRVMELIQEMYDTYQQKRYGYEMRVKGLYYLLLHLLVTEYRELDSSKEQINWNRKLNHLSRITSYIKEHYTEDLSLESLAEIFSYSPAYLSRIFRKYTGINYKAYLESVRLEHAYQELANTSHTLCQIAIENGFPGSRAFARAFQKKYGALPSEFRKERQKSAINWTSNV